MEDNLDLLESTPSLNEDDLKDITNLISEHNTETKKDNDILSNVYENGNNTIESTNNLNTTTETENNTIEENRLASFLENDLEPKSEECTALVTVKERRIMAAQTMFKRSIKVTIKSFLISLSLSFLNFFI